MSNIADDPGYSFGRAREVRELLKSISDAEMREIIDEISESHDRIAEEENKIAQ